MGLFSWVGQKLSSGKQAVVRKITENAVYKAAANGLSVTLTFLRENRDGLNKAMMQFVAGLTRVTHLWKLVLLPIFYPETFRALAAAQKRVIFRLLASLGYYQVLRPGLTELSSLAHDYARVSVGYQSYAISGVGYTLDGITMAADSAVVIWTVREATTAMFLDNMIYNSAVAAASARDGSVSSGTKEKSTNPLMTECGDGGYLSASLMNIATYSINKVFFVLTYYAPYPYKPFLTIARLANDGMGYRQYQTAAAGMCITHQNDYFRDKIFDALAEGVIAEMMYQGGMWMLTSATPYQIVAKFIPSAIVASTPVKCLSALLPFEPGFILSFTLSEVVAASTALTLIALGNMTRELEVPKGTDLFNILYPAQVLTEKIGSYLGAQGDQHYKSAKNENPTDWVTVANNKLMAWWDGYLLYGLRNVLIRDCPQSWDHFMQRESVQVYWVASRGQLKKTVADSVAQLTSPGAKVGRLMGISKIADSLFFLNAETRAAIKYFMKNGSLRILRATNEVLQRVKILDDELKPVGQLRRVTASAPVEAMRKVRNSEPSRVNLQQISEGLSHSPANSRTTSATSAGSVGNNRRFQILGGSRVKDLPDPASVKMSRKPVDPEVVQSNVPVKEAHLPDDSQNDTFAEPIFLMEDAIVEPLREKTKPSMVEVIEEYEEPVVEANDNSGSAVFAKSVKDIVDPVPQPLVEMFNQLEQQGAGVETPASPLQSSTDKTDLSPQMLAISREWNERRSSPNIPVSAPVPIPQPEKAAQNVEGLLAKKPAKGVSRVALGMAPKKK